MGEGPVFVGGLDHSGKTLMRLSLSAHPNIAMTRRTYMWTRFYNRYGDLSQRGNFERCLRAMLQHKQMQVLKPDANRIRREFWRGKPSYARLFALLHEHHAEQLGKRRWGDQLGHVERYADPIFAAYPTAKMIHMIRDPRDTNQVSTTSSLRNRFKVGRAVARWCSSAQLAHRNLRLYVDRYLIVRYESLLSQREATLRQVCDFLEEDYAPSMLTLEGALRFGNVKDVRGQVDPNVVTTPPAAPEHASHLLPTRELACLQAYAGREMALHGYRLHPVEFSLVDRLAFYCVDWPASLAGVMTWQTLEAVQSPRS